MKSVYENLNNMNSEIIETLCAKAIEFYNKEQNNDDFEIISNYCPFVNISGLGFTVFEHLYELSKVCNLLSAIDDVEKSILSLLEVMKEVKLRKSELRRSLKPVLVTVTKFKNDFDEIIADNNYNKNSFPGFAFSNVQLNPIRDDLGEIKIKLNKIFSQDNPIQYLQEIIDKPLNSLMSTSFDAELEMKDFQERMLDLCSAMEQKIFGDWNSLENRDNKHETVLKNIKQFLNEFLITQEPEYDK